MHSYSPLLQGPRNDSYNYHIAWLRMLLALYIFMFHLIPRYLYFNYDLNILWYIQKVTIQVFHGANETNPAVIAFVVMSGYCIHRNGLRIDDMDVISFLRKRIYKIVPMLFIGYCLGLVTFYSLCSDPRFKTILNTESIKINAILLKFFGVFSFFPYRFEEFIHQGNGPLMTCIVEFWLYVFYPFGLLLSNKFGDKLFWLFISSIAILILFVSYITENSSWWHNGSFFGFLCYWWIGVYSATNSGISKYSKLIGLFYLLTTLFLMTNNNLIIVELRKILFAMLIVMFLQYSEQLKQFTFGKDFFKSNYSLYCLHVPLITLALFFRINIYVAIILILSISYLIYLYIEKKFIVISKLSVNTIDGLKAIN